MPLTPDEAFRLLETASAQDRLGHAYLITGAPGSGKRDLALRLCGLVVGQADGARAASHPDVHTVEPESKSRRIVIEQMRELERQLQMRASQGGRKAGVIFDADRLQPQASNAFLKTLEEPPARTHLFLVTAVPDQLLETILSRCIEIPLNTPERRSRSEREDKLLGLLAHASRRGGGDLPVVFRLVREFQGLLAEAKEAAQDAGEAELKAEEQRYKQIADAKWFDEREERSKAIIEANYVQERGNLVEVLERWFADILRQQVSAGALDFTDHAETTAGIAARLSPAEALRQSAAMERLREQLGSPGIQEGLAIEVAFLNAFGGK